MTVARFRNQAIAGEKITYSFGKAVPNRNGKRFDLSLNLNGKAFIAQRWEVAKAAEIAPPAVIFDELDARAADGEGDKHKNTGQVHVGRHREWTGVLTGRAIVRVTAPRANVEHLQPPG